MVQNKNEGNKQLLQYASLGMQFLLGIALTVFIGLKVDKWLNWSFPLLVWLFPLLLIVAMIIKIMKETSKKK